MVDSHPPPTPDSAFAEVLGRRLSRRDFLKGGLAAGLVIYLPGIGTMLKPRPPLRQTPT